MDNIKHYDPKGSSYSERIPDHKWEEMRPVIECLHQSGMSRKLVLKRLTEEYNFHPSRAQLNSRMSAWGYTVREGLNDRQESDLPNEPSVALRGVGGLDKFGPELKLVDDLDNEIKELGVFMEQAFIPRASILDPDRSQDLRLHDFEFSYSRVTDDAYANCLPSPHNDAKRLNHALLGHEPFPANVSQLERATVADPDYGISDDVLYDLESTSSFRSFRRTGKSMRDVQGPSSVCGASTFSAASMKTTNSEKLIERLFPTY